MAASFFLQKKYCAMISRDALGYLMRMKQVGDCRGIVKSALGSFYLFIVLVVAVLVYLRYATPLSGPDVTRCAKIFGKNPLREDILYLPALDMFPITVLVTNATVLVTALAMAFVNFILAKEYS